MIRTCDSGHSSLDAANWHCPWCEVAALKERLESIGPISLKDAYIDRLSEALSESKEGHTVLMRKYVALHDINEALKADAERYRYLRSADRRECLTDYGPEAGCWIDCEDSVGNLILLTGADADAAIDAAIDAASCQAKVDS
jgi:hypothetical protein